jgi:hypothetical protein
VSPSLWHLLFLLFVRPAALVCLELELEGKEMVSFHFLAQHQFIQRLACTPSRCLLLSVAGAGSCRTLLLLESASLVCCTFTCLESLDPATACTRSVGGHALGRAGHVISWSSMDKLAGEGVIENGVGYNWIELEIIVQRLHLDKDWDGSFVSVLHLCLDHLARQQIRSSD